MSELEYEIGSFCYFPKREDDKNIIEAHKDKKTLPEEE